MRLIGNNDRYAGAIIVQLYSKGQASSLHILAREVSHNSKVCTLRAYGIEC